MTLKSFDKWYHRQYKIKEKKRKIKEWIKEVAIVYNQRNFKSLLPK